MKLRTLLQKNDKYTATAAVAPGGWCCHCHCSAKLTDDGSGDPYGYGGGYGYGAA